MPPVPFHTTRPLIAVTMGDPNGIGPEVTLKALAHPDLRERCTCVVIGDPGVFNAARARFAPQCAPAVVVDDIDAATSIMGAIPLLPIGPPPPALRYGTLDPEAGRCAVEWVIAAVRVVMEGHAQALVTGPINKEAIHRAGYPYQGHTDLIAEMTNSPDYRMCLFAGKLRAVHLTGHLSLRDALAAVTKERILRSVQIAGAGLQRLGIKQPRIAVAGLNPHAGEAGAFGDEDLREVLPAVEAARAEGFHCFGPISPDAVFRAMADGEYDVVIALYHDQGHIPLKLVAMDEGVNVTLGIPIIRTSCDHGTAFAIAGQGVAREASMLAALRLAAQFAASDAAGARA